jgi:hypothetical protein
MFTNPINVITKIPDMHNSRYISDHNERMPDIKQLGIYV